MRGTRQATTAVVVFIGSLTGTVSSSVCAQSSDIDIDAVEASIKAPDSPEARTSMQSQIAALRASSSSVLSSEAALETSNTIYLNHNRSLLEEAFYHLEQIVPYADFDERLYLRKLQSLKSNKDRFDHDEIDQSRFESEAQRADRVYAEELEDARNHLAGKAARLAEICDNLEQNVEALRENMAAAQSSSMPRALTRRITSLRSHQTWIDFTTPTETGWHMRRALEQAEDSEPQAIVACISNAFAAYEATPGGVIIDRALVGELVKQSQ